ncbi:MAG: YraN family protein [Chloroflexota bacterium]|nr:YraN family protein [Chloroflexota bacterium]
MRGTRGLGDAGEKLALRRLLELGYELLETNWRCRNGEIDLVMRDGETLVFVEVRTRRGEGLGTPEESVTLAKQQRLVSLATQWLAERYPEEEPPDWRIDVVGVHLSTSGKLLEINHLPGAIGFG